MLLHTHHSLFCKFRIFCISQPLKDLMRDLCSNQDHSFWFTTILNCLRRNVFCKIKIIFALNTFQTMLSLHLWKNILKTQFILLFLLKSNYLLADPLGHLILWMAALFRSKKKISVDSAILSKEWAYKNVILTFTIQFFSLLLQGFFFVGGNNFV